MEITLTDQTLEKAMTAIGGIRGAKDPVSTYVKDVQLDLGGNCCKVSKREFVGHIGVDNGNRFKRMTVCACCRQLHVDDDGRAIHGSIRDYLSNLMAKSKRLGQEPPTLYIQNVEATLPSAPPKTDMQRIAVGR